LSPGANSNPDSAKPFYQLEIFDREQSLLIRELMVDNGLPIRMTVAAMTRS
jgi:hypothetical protein